MRILYLLIIALFYCSCSTNMNKTQNNEGLQDSLNLKKETQNPTKDEFSKIVNKIPIAQIPFGFKDLYNTIKLEDNEENYKKHHWSPAQNKAITNLLNGQYYPNHDSIITERNNSFQYSLLNRETSLTLINRLPSKDGNELLLYSSHRWREGDSEKYPAWYLFLVNPQGELIDELYVAGIDHKESDLYTETLFWIDENWQIHISYFVPLNESDYDEESSQDSTLQLKSGSYQRFIDIYTIDNRFKHITRKQRNIHDGTFSDPS